MKIKVQEKNTSCELAWNLNQWKTFSKNGKPRRVWLWFFYKLTRIIVACNFSPSSFKLIRGILPSLADHITPKFFLWIMLLQNLLLAKYLIPVAAALKNVFNYFLVLLFWTSASIIYKSSRKGVLKGAAKLHFVHCFSVIIIILFNTDLYVFSSKLFFKKSSVSYFCVLFSTRCHLYRLNNFI